MEEISEEAFSFGDDFFDSDPNRSQEKRTVCYQCQRPISVCWCSYLPTSRLNILTAVHILQHPHEEKRRIQTARILELALQEDMVFTYKGSRFNEKKYPKLSSIAKKPTTVLLFPTPDADVLTEDSDNEFIKDIIILDGTWHQARAMYVKNTFLHGIKKVALNISEKSQYVIRTQPTASCVSTVEAVGIALSLIEGKKLFEPLCKPLQAICDFQIQHGSVVHEDKETRILNGTYQKAVSNKTMKQLNKLKQMKDCS